MADQDIFADMTPEDKKSAAPKKAASSDIFADMTPTKESGGGFIDRGFKVLHDKLIDMGVPLPKSGMPSGNINLGEMPSAFRIPADYLASSGSGRSGTEAMQQNLGNVGQGIREIGQGAKQMALGAGEYAGVVPFGTQNDYTKETEAQHEQFANTPAGRDPFGKDIREEIKDLPFQALTAIPGLGEGGLVTKALKSGVGGAIGKNIEYRKPGEDRFWATLKGGGIGALMGALMGAPETANKVLGAYENIGNLEAGSAEARAAHDQALKAEQQQINASTGAPADLRSQLEQAQAKYEASQGKQSALKTQQIQGSPEERAQLDKIKAEQAAAAERKLQAEAESKIDHPDLVIALDAAKAEHAANQGQLAEAGSQAKQSPLKKKDVDTMQADLDMNKQKIASIDKQLAHQEPVTSPAQYMMDTPAEAATRLREAEQTHAAAKQVVEDLDAKEQRFDKTVEPQIKQHDAAIAKADQAIGEHLETNAEHNVRGAKIVGEDLEKNRKEISKQFNDLEASTAKQKVEITPESTKTAKEINDELLKLADTGKNTSKEATKLAEQLAAIGKKKTIPANEYIASYRSVNSYLRKAKENAYKHGLNPEVQAEWKKTAAELETQLRKMDSILEQSLPKEDYAKFKGSADRWRKEVVPLYGNPVYRRLKIRKTEIPGAREAKGKLPNNTMEALAGDEEGNVLIRNAIQANPQALKHVVGQKYASETGKNLIHNPNEQVAGYTQKMPELQQLIAEKRAVEAAKEHQVNNIATLKQANADAREKALATQARANDFVAQQREAKKAADIMNTDYMTKINNIKDLGQQKRSLENMNGLLEKHIGDLKQSSQQIKQSEQKVKQAEQAISAGRQKKLQELNKAKQDLFDLQQRAMQTKGKIELQKRKVGTALEEEKISGKLAKQATENINRQIRAIEKAQQKSAQQAASERRMTKQKLDNINMDLNKAIYKKDAVVSKLKTIGWIAAGLVGAGGLTKALKATGAVTSLAGEEK